MHGGRRRLCHAERLEGRRESGAVVEEHVAHAPLGDGNALERTGKAGIEEAIQVRHGLAGDVPQAPLVWLIRGRDAAGPKIDEHRGHVLRRFDEVARRVDLGPETAGVVDADERLIACNLPERFVRPPRPIAARDDLVEIRQDPAGAVCREFCRAHHLSRGLLRYHGLVHPENAIAVHRGLLHVTREIDMAVDDDGVRSGRLEERREHSRMEDEIRVHVNEPVPDEFARQPQRVTAARRGVLGVLDIGHRHVQVRTDLFLLIPDHQHHVRDAALAKGGELILEDRPASDFQEALGPGFRVRQQTAAKSGGEDDCSHRLAVPRALGLRLSY